MKIKKIINLCKENGELRIFENEGKQWISDGCSLYPLLGLPLFDEATICAAYDIPPKKAAQMHICFDLQIPSSFDIRDDTENELICDRGEPLYSGLIPITTSHGIEFIQSKYLAPFADSDDNMLYIFERQSEAGTNYFAVKEGFMLVGIIFPYDCINEGFVNNLKKVYEQCEIALYNKQHKAERDGK